jgi:hypothetical protein
MTSVMLKRMFVLTTNRIIRLCSLKYLEWAILYTIVFTEVPGVGDLVYDCVH